jgi:hypothetical protein
LNVKADIKYVTTISIKFCRSAKAGYYASRYKRFGNLCYVIGALQAFVGHHNEDLRIRVSAVKVQKAFFFPFSYFILFLNITEFYSILLFAPKVLFICCCGYRSMRVSGKYILK